MAYCTSRLTVILLVLVVASLARGQGLVFINQAVDGGGVQGNKENTETLVDIQQRLLDLERMLVKQYISIDAQLKNLHLELAELSNEGQRNVLVRDVISAISRGHFRFAEEKLIQLGDLVPISDIVHEVYAGSECNFGLLVNLTQSLSKITPTYQFLSTLYDEMKKNGHKDVKNLITLAKAFESEILQQVNNPEDVKSTVHDILEELREAITAEASNYLIAAMQSERNYVYNEGVMGIAAALATYQPGVAAAVMQRTVEGVFKTVDHKKILEAVNSHADIWQKLTGIDALFQLLKAEGPLQGSVVIPMALYLSQIFNQTEYASLDPAKRLAAEALVASVPASARNLYFLPTFCIYSKLQDSYLLASPLSLHDTQRRNVFTVPRSRNGPLPAGSTWRVRTIGDKLFFDSVDFPGENIYAAEINYDKRIHYVFGWIPGNNTDPQSAWTLELDGESVYFKNDYFDEYLYASDTVNILAGNKYAFSIKKRDAENTLPFLWQITDC